MRSPAVEQRGTFLRRHWENSRREGLGSIHRGEDDERRDWRMRDSRVVPSLAGRARTSELGEGTAGEVEAGHRHDSVGRVSPMCRGCGVSPNAVGVLFTVASGKRNATNGSNEWDRKASFPNVRRWGSVRAGERSPARGLRLVGGLLGFRAWGCVVSRDGRGSSEDSRGLFPLSVPLSFLFTHL